MIKITRKGCECSISGWGLLIIVCCCCCARLTQLVIWPFGLSKRERERESLLPVNGLFWGWIFKLEKTKRRWRSSLRRRRKTKRNYQRDSIRVISQVVLSLRPLLRSTPISTITGWLDRRSGSKGRGEDRSRSRSRAGQGEAGRDLPGKRKETQSGRIQLVVARLSSLSQLSRAC